MAEFLAIMQQHGYEFIVQGLKRRIGVHIEHLKVDVELSQQRPQRHLHLLAEMTVAARNERQYR